MQRNKIPPIELVIYPKRRRREKEGRRGKGEGEGEGVKSFVASCWHLLEPFLTCFAPDEIQFVAQSTML